MPLINGSHKRDEKVLEKLLIITTELCKRLTMPDFDSSFSEKLTKTDTNQLKYFFSVDVKN